MDCKFCNQILIASEEDDRIQLKLNSHVYRLLLKIPFQPRNIIRKIRPIIYETTYFSESSHYIVQHIIALIQLMF